MRLAQTHATAAATAQAQPEGPPGLDAVQDGAYFPDSRVASRGEWVSPLSYRGSGGPRPEPNDVLTLPRGGESPWIVPAQSDEQGLGRSPGQQWPWQIVTEAYNFEQLAIMPFENDQTHPGEIPGGWDGRNPPERAATFARAKGGHVYYEQTEGYVTSDVDQVAVTEDPASTAYTIGWGALDSGGGGGLDFGSDDGYGY